MRSLLSIALLAALASAAVAQVVTSDNLSPRTTAVIDTQATGGHMMDGMTVRVTYRDGSTNTAIWGDTGGFAGGAFGTDWSLTLNGNTFDQPWVFSVSSAGTKGVQNIFIDAADGKATFDIISGTFETPGSFNGHPFQVLSGIAKPSEVLANYSRPLGVTPDAPVGDLFTTLSIELGSQAIAPGNSFTFRADTDSAVTDIVPEPASMTALALGALALLRRRRSR